MTGDESSSTSMIAYDLTDPVPAPSLQVAHLAGRTEHDVGEMVIYGNNLVGEIIEVRTEPFEFDGVDGLVEATEDSPTYVVDLEGGGQGVFKGSQLDSLPPENSDGSPSREAR